MSGILVLVAIVCLYRRRNGSETRIGAPFMSGPLRRVLLVLVVIGLVLIATMPEAFFVLPAIDAVGLDVTTILIALELQRYMDSALRLIAMPAARMYWRGALHGCRRVAVMEPALVRRRVSSFVTAVYLMMVAGTTLRCLGGPPHS